MSALRPKLAITEGEMWPRTNLLDLLGITHPIIQAPMSGFSGPVLVAAVSNAGALGSLSCATLPVQTARDQIEEIRRATNRLCVPKTSSELMTRWN